jgi:hypothetical protein
MLLFWFLVTRLQNITVALCIRFGGQPGRSRPNNEKIFSLSKLESNPFTYGWQTNCSLLKEGYASWTYLFIYFHVIPCDRQMDNGRNLCYSLTQRRRCYHHWSASTVPTVLKVICQEFITFSRIVVFFLSEWFPSIWISDAWESPKRKYNIQNTAKVWNQEFFWNCFSIPSWWYFVTCCEYCLYRGKYTKPKITLFSDYMGWKVLKLPPYI